MYPAIISEAEIPDVGYKDSRAYYHIQRFIIYKQCKLGRLAMDSLEKLDHELCMVLVGELVATTPKKVGLQAGEETKKTNETD